MTDIGPGPAGTPGYGAPPPGPPGYGGYGGYGAPPPGPGGYGAPPPGAPGYGAPPAGPPYTGPGAPGQPPRGTSRALKNPLVRVAIAVAAIALGWGAVHVATGLWAGRHDNTPVASASRGPSHALRVSGRGVTLTFPRGWVNVPTTPNQFAKFLHETASKLPHLRAAAKAELENRQEIRNLAMLVYRVNRGGIITGSTNVLVEPATIPLREILPHVKGAVSSFGATHVHSSVTTVGKYAAVVVTYTAPHLAGRPAEYGAQAYVHGPSSTPIITVTTTTARSAVALLRQIAGTIVFG